MKPVPHHRPSNAGLVILGFFIVIGFMQRGCVEERRVDPCAGHKAVTIGGSMVIGCQ